MLASGETVLGAERYAAMHGQAERLLPMVDDVMRGAGLSASALDIIGVTIGPGSFTGIRAGLAERRRIRIIGPLFAGQRPGDGCVPALEGGIGHGGGAGHIQIWGDDAWLICDVAGNGLITDPLVGRRRPDARRGGGLGLWIVNQLCDLVQLRSSPDGTVVRMHMLLTA